MFFSNKTFSFGYLIVEKNLPWFRKLLEHTLPMRDNSTPKDGTSLYAKLKVRSITIIIILVLYFVQKFLENSLSFEWIQSTITFFSWRHNVPSIFTVYQPSSNCWDSSGTVRLETVFFDLPPNAHSWQEETASKSTLPRIWWWWWRYLGFG